MDPERRTQSAAPASAFERDLTRLLRLFQLVSPALPLGAYAYSQGLEYAVHAGWVRDETTTLHWLQGLTQASVGTLDLPILTRLHRGWQADDLAAIQQWTAVLLAARETAELRAEERHLGQALARILLELDVSEASRWTGHQTTLATLFGLAAVRWEIGAADALSGYLWSWSENQVLAAVRLVPLGQSAGQRLLRALSAAMPCIVERALRLSDADVGISTPSQAMASALHESQYTRLFRS
jgi:urease accessory protein